MKRIDFYRFFFSFKFKILYFSLFNLYNYFKKQKVFTGMIAEKKKSIIGCMLLTLTALVWGVGFVAQSSGSESIGPYTFTSVRFIIAAAALFIVVIVRDSIKNKKTDIREEKTNSKLVWISGIITGALLAVAANLQQVGISLGASAGKAAFLTAAYIILVPIISLIIFKKKCSFTVWIGVVLSLAGLYLLCMNGGFSFELSDLILLCCALAFSFQIIAIDKFVSKTDALKMSCIEFLVCGVLSAIPMVAVEICVDSKAWGASLSNAEAWLPILYAGVISGGVGYTLQAIVQKSVAPAKASLIMCFESVFGALAGWIILGQTMSGREIIGSVLMFAAIIIAQTEIKITKKEKKDD